jgi:hypothetical protein
MRISVPKGRQEKQPASLSKSKHVLTRFSNTLEIFEPPITLPPIEISAYWHLRTQDDPGH